MTRFRRAVAASVLCIVALAAPSIGRAQDPQAWGLRHIDSVGVIKLAGSLPGVDSAMVLRETVAGLREIGIVPSRGATLSVELMVLPLSRVNGQGTVFSLRLRIDRQIRLNGEDALVSLWNGKGYMSFVPPNTPLNDVVKQTLHAALTKLGDDRREAGKYRFQIRKPPS